MQMHRPAAVTKFIQWLCVALVCAGIPGGAVFAQERPPGQPAARASGREEQPLQDILHYISSDWDRLTRSIDDCATFADPKVIGKPVLYFAAGVPVPANLANLENRCSVRIAHLPVRDLPGGGPPQLQQPGLLYLEHSYVVPGGQFNEMYGWDSYFIVRGLLEDGRRDLARGMVENFFYEIEHYGGVLNANRTYYLGRSQPPFLSSMILAVYEADRSAGAASQELLERAYAFAKRDYEQWTHAPHLAGETGLSRYFDEGNGPVPEILGDPSDYYRSVARYFLVHEGADSSHLVHVDAQHPAASIVGPMFPVFVCDPGFAPQQSGKCGPEDEIGLAPDAYKGDRSMRESGFDVSFRFGPYSIATHHFAPDCLNSLLYKTEMDLEEMSRLLGRADDAHNWHEKAQARKEQMEKYLWNAQVGLFFDYDFMTGKQSSYDYVTAFYGLWAGIASQDQAYALERNLALFEQPGGLAMSRYESHAQWDYPYGWAPVHLLAIEGLRRYGDSPDADRLTYKFLSMVLHNFQRDRTLREKYNVVTQSSETHIDIGYARNENGFGWTNAVFLVLLHQAPPGVAAQLGRN